MYLSVLAAVVVCLAAWLYSRWLKVKRFWADRGVPHLPPHPIFGSLTFLQQVNPGIWMQKIYEHFDSPYVGAWMFWRPALIINSPEIARNVLVKDSAVFRNRFLSSASHDTIGSLNIFTANDPLWSNVRRRLTPMFTSSKLKTIQLLMASKSKELVQRIAMERKKGRFNIKSIYNDYTTDIIGTASFGIESDATLTGDSALRTVTKDFEKFSFYRGCAWSSIFFFPELVKVFRFRFFPKAATDYFRKIFHIIVEQRKEEFQDNAEPRDLLDILLKMKKQSIEENDEISDEVIISQAAIFLQAGYDTSGTGLSFGTYELAHHPEIQEKLYKELKEAKEKIGGADFDDTTLSQMTYLNCIVKEIFRKYQPMAWLDRIGTRDYAIDDKLTIPAGTPIYVNVMGMHYDPNYFPEPNKFDPDRFLPENECNIKKFTYMPFGEGPRICIGQRFGLANMRNSLATLVLNYELKPFPNTPKPADIEIEKNGLFLTPGEPLYVDFVPRI
ncbi:cytochrome P450 6k1-like [Epargyreus clarus]|uniref:cytochrome P450 6k1-like n=1 Tax=Epargyreus clarus TaxID=520877 RepID=UPI003C2F76EF